MKAMQTTSRRAVTGALIGLGLSTAFQAGRIEAESNDSPPSRFPITHGGDETGRWVEYGDFGFMLHWLDYATNRLTYTAHRDSLAGPYVIDDMGTPWTGTKPPRPPEPAEENG